MQILCIWYITNKVTANLSLCRHLLPSNLISSCTWWWGLSNHLTVLSVFCDVIILLSMMVVVSYMTAHTVLGFPLIHILSSPYHCHSCRHRFRTYEMVVHHRVIISFLRRLVKLHIIAYTYYHWAISLWETTGQVLCSFKNQLWSYYWDVWFVKLLTHLYRF